VASVPYDVVNREEAKALAEGNPYSYLRITKPEIELDPSVDAKSPEVYEHGAKTLKKFMRDGVLVRDEIPCLYAYALTDRGHTQTGIAMCGSVEDYEQNIIRKHEFTRPDKEDDRVKHMQILGAQTGTVFLVHRDDDAIAAAMATATARDPVVDFVAADGVEHRLWVIDDPDVMGSVITGFDRLGPIYIADGHHRSAAAGRICAAGDYGAAAKGFLAVSFPISEVKILPYNRIVRDLAGHTTESFLQTVLDFFTIRPTHQAPERGEFGMYLDGKWYLLIARPPKETLDPIGALDVSILQNQLLDPILGIQDPRRDKRVDFVGGSRGEQELVKRVSEGWAAAFSMHPTSLEDLLTIADADGVMPPKSTWFEPKLRDGLLTHLLS